MDLLTEIRQRPQRLEAAVAIIIFLQVIYIYLALPETIASHFDSAGQPNDWSNKGGFLLMLGLIIMLVMFSCHWLPNWLMRKHESLLNIPNKNYWLAPERKAATMFHIQRSMTWLSIITVGLIAAMLQLTIAANQSESFQLSSLYIWIMAFFGIAMVVWMYRLVSWFNRPGLSSED